MLSLIVLLQVQDAILKNLVQLTRIIQEKDKAFVLHVNLVMIVQLVLES